MDLLTIISKSQGPWGDLTRNYQGVQTEKWRDPSWFLAAGIIIFSQESDSSVLDTKVLTSVNLTEESFGVEQIHFGGFLNPTKDFLGPEFAAVRELWEETGYLPKLDLETVQNLPEITFLHAPTFGEVTIESSDESREIVLRNDTSGKNVYPHPHSIQIFATDAVYEKVGCPDTEVTDVKWQRIGDVIEECGRNMDGFYHPGVLFGFINWLKTGRSFRYSNQSGQEYRLSL